MAFRHDIGGDVPWVEYFAGRTIREDDLDDATIFIQDDAESSDMIYIYTHAHGQGFPGSAHIRLTLDEVIEVRDALNRFIAEKTSEEE
jgi:hypothetical protein